MSSKKYKLFSTANGEKATCAFFASPAGCRNGTNCKFSHGEPIPSSSPAPNKVELSDASVSSESDGEMPTNPSPQKQVKKENPVPNQKADKKKKRKSMDDGDIFSKPKNATNGRGREQQTAPSSNKKQKQTNDSTPTATATTAKAKTKPTPSSSTSSFSSFVSNLPIASFSTTGANVATPQKKEESLNVSSNTPGKKGTTPKKDKHGILPTSTAVGRKWQKSVVQTRKHERYATSYDFKRYKENDSNSGLQPTWVKAKPYGEWCASNLQAIAIDCEMCESQDPLSGAKNPKALCRLSVVNAENPEEVLLDTLVKPVWPVTDYRTRINGIAKEHLENVEFTLRHAQAFMLTLCSQETVIVGHAVHNDLVALNMEHDVVADSSFLFRAEDSPTATPSLKDTVKTMLKKDMPDTHDSVNDARKALECVLHWVQKDGKVEMVQRSAKRSQSNGHQLFIHRIPRICNEEHLSSMFLKHSSIQPTEVEGIQFSGKVGKTHVSFKSPRHANLAFDTLDGNAEEEKSGRLQKKVYLRNGDYIRVRKMIHAKRSNAARDGNTQST
jgi:RNA exonuclease 1